MIIYSNGKYTREAVMFDPDDILGNAFALMRGAYKAVKFSGKVIYGAHMKSKEEQQVEDLMTRAMNGDADAQYEFGYGLLSEYEKGDDPRMVAKAYELIFESASQGNERAEAFLDSLQD